MTREIRAETARPKPAPPWPATVKCPCRQCDFKGADRANQPQCLHCPANPLSSPALRLRQRGAM
jgi:hypothetical protein